MKRATLLLVLLFLSSCQTCTGIGSFTVTRTTAPSVVEGSNTPLNDLLPETVIPALDLEFDLDSELQKRDAKGASAVYLNALTLRVTDDAKADDSDEDTFDFLSNVSFYVASANANSDLERVLVASIDPVPQGRTELMLETDDSVDLKPYAQEGIVLTTSGAGSVPPDDVSIVGDVTLEIETL